MVKRSKAISSGVLVSTAVRQILLGKATGSPRWDIPKGLVEPGEDWHAAAARELEEETGLIATAAELRPVGHFAYLPGKDLVLFTWRPPAPIDPAVLRCRSTFTTRDGRELPEMERFALVPWHLALDQVGKNMARVLSALDPAAIFE